MRRAGFRKAWTRITSPRARVARFAGLHGAGAARSLGRTCPEEPEQIRSLRTDLDLADAPLDASDVFARGVTRFFIAGNSAQVTTVDGADYDGKVTERVRWTLTFTRI